MLEGPELAGLPSYNINFVNFVKMHGFVRAGFLSVTPVAAFISIVEKIVSVSNSNVVGALKDKYLQKTYI